MAHIEQDLNDNSIEGSTSMDQFSSDPFQQQLDWAHRRTQKLMDESRQYQIQIRALRDESKQFAEDRRSFITLLGRAETLVQAMERGIKLLQGSTALQVGYLITQSARSFSGLVKLPVRIFRLLRQVARTSPAESGDAQVVPVPLPHEWFPIDLRRELANFHADLNNGPRSAVNALDEGLKSGGRSTSLSILPARLSEIRVGAVMDEFTFSAFSACCDITQLTPEGYRKELDSIKPHFIFIESAWDGTESRWQRKVSSTSKELRALAAYGREKRIPVVFWSKEDPVHFKTFLSSARLADVVFTTDIDCVKHYKTELGHDRVYLLPFATQPLSHNPIERYDRKPGFCFAGSYYVRYPVRQLDFSSILRAVSQLGSVDIYDRNHGKNHPNYKFPADYDKYIIGNLSFDQIDLAYKGYDFGININTVKNSQSMFARRVFDLLASNTTTVSNYSRGLKLMFGDLVVSSDNTGQLLKRLPQFAGDAVFRRKHRLLGLRKVMSEHTYQHRLAYLLGKIYGAAPQVEQPEVTVLARAASSEELKGILENFGRQVWPHKKLVLCFGAGFHPHASPVADGIHILSNVQADKCRVVAITGTGYLAGFHPDDYYGENYLTDLALAASYSPAPVIGKVAHYRSESGFPMLIRDGAQYRTGGLVNRRRGIALASQLGDDTVSDWLDDISDGTFSADSLAVDEFNYCEASPCVTECAETDDLVGLDQGMPTAQLLAVAEAIRGDRSGAAGAQCNEAIGLPGLDAAELYDKFGAPDNKYLSTTMANGVLLLHATLPPGRRAYAYLEGTFTPKQLNFTDIARMHLVGQGNEGLNLVLVYKDENDEKISHSLLKYAANVTANVPEGTRSVQVGVRVTQAGTYPIRKLAFDTVPLSVDTMVSRSRTLLLAKNYPSYDDYYKHAFVHRRVVEYRRQGVCVDVFRLGVNGLSFYEFDGVDVAYGQVDHLRSILQSGSYESVLVHFLDEKMWEVLQEFVHRTRIIVWAHGAEIQSASRREFDHVDDATRSRAVALGNRRMTFWRRIFSEAHPNLTMVFVSRWFAQDVMEDVGKSLPDGSYKIIHNFIDTELFKYRVKPESQRCRILSIRPYESNKYANDLSVAAVLALRDKSFFNDLEFRFIGDGRLFEETMAPLRGLPNVVIEQGFLGQDDISELHAHYGVFLSPTRMDAQGVSRDEAMSSGLVPISNRVTAIPEFVDEDCGILAEAESAQGLAEAIERLYRDPALFQRLSAAAAARVRDQSGFQATIARELEMIAEVP